MATGDQGWSDWAGLRQGIDIRTPQLWLAAVLGVATVLMVVGTWRTTPHIMLPDEYARPKLVEVITSSPFLSSFGKGGNLYAHVVSVIVFPLYALFSLTGQSGTQMASHGLLFLARLASVAFGVATVGVVYLLGRELDDEWTGLLAAGSLTVCWGFVMAAHYATEDALVSLMIAICLYLYVRYWHSPSSRGLYLAAFTTGLAISAKATAGILVLPLGLLTLNRFDSRAIGFRTAIKRIVPYAFVSWLGYLLTTPGLVVHPRNWVSELLRYAGLASGSSTPYLPPDPGWLMHLSHLSVGLGVPLFVLCLVGVAYAIRRTATEGTADGLWILLAFVVPFFLAISSWEMVQYPRVIPLFVPLVVLGALAGRVAFRANTGRHRLIVGGLLAVVVLSSAVYTVPAAASFGTSHTEAADWIAANVEDEAVVDTHAQRVYLPAFPANVTVNRYEVTRYEDRANWSVALDRLRCGAPDVVVMSSFHYDRFFKDPTRFPEVTTTYGRLFNGELDYTVTATFGQPHNQDVSASEKFRGSLTYQPYVRRMNDLNPTIYVFERTEPAAETCPNA